MSAQHEPAVATVQDFARQAVRQVMGRSTDVDACLDLVAAINQLLDQAATRLPSREAPLACRAGCNFCCHLRVMVLPHEAIALFRHLQSRMAPLVAQQVRGRLLSRTMALEAAQSRQPCAFLVEGRCAAYEVRPAACAAYHSLSQDVCERAFKDPSASSGTVALQSLQRVAQALEEGVHAGLSSEGLNNTPLELHTAVAALLANPALIARWRAGRPLLNPNPGGP